MRQLLLVLVLVTALTLAAGGTALAQHGDPIGGCPDNFELHHMHAMGDGNHMHLNRVCYTSALDAQASLCCCSLYTKQRNLIQSQRHVGLMLTVQQVAHLMPCLRHPVLGNSGSRD